MLRPPQSIKIRHAIKALEKKLKLNHIFYDQLANQLHTHPYGKSRSEDWVTIGQISNWRYAFIDFEIYETSFTNVHKMRITLSDCKALGYTY